MVIWASIGLGAVGISIIGLIFTIASYAKHKRNGGFKHDLILEHKD